MASRVLTLDLPEDVVALLGAPGEAAAQAKELLVVELLRRGRIGQSRAAEVLGTTRWGILELMGRYDIPQGPETAEELERELEQVRRTLAKAGRPELNAASFPPG